MDLDDDLLALVGDEPAQSTSQAPAESDSEDAGNKRKRARDDSGSDMEESDSSDDEGRAAGTNQSEDFVSPFPYQTLFHDKADKAHIMALNEVERESILAERQDEVQKQKDRIQVRKMATQLAGGRPPGDGTSAAPASSDGPLGALHVRGKSDRKKTQTGKNEKKSSTLDELKRKRESKKRREAGEEDDEDDFGGSSSKPAVRRQSPKFSDDDDDDDDASDQDVTAAPSSSRFGKKKFSDEESVDELGLRALFLQRNHCLQHWNKPWFARAATGAYVRIVVGPDPQDPKENVYRLCSVSGIVEPFSAGELQAREKAAEEAAREAAQDANSDMEASDSDDEANGVRKNNKQHAGGGGKANSASQKKLQSIQADLATEKKRRAFQPYKLPDGGDLCDVMLDVRHGKAAKQVPITALSNQPFSRREYQRLVATYLNDNVGMPLKTDAEPKASEIKDCLASMRSEADIDHALRKKKMLHDPKHVVFIKTMCRDATSSESQRKRLESEIQSITARLPGAAYLSSSTAPGTPGSSAKHPESPGKRPPLGAGAEGSRGSSQSLVQLSERNRRANREEVRRAEQAANEARRKAEGTGRVDPSARVRTSVKVLHDVRASTPDPNQTVVFEAPTNAQDESSAKMKAVVAEAQGRNKVGPTKLEESAKDIAVDLGDF